VPRLADDRATDLDLVARDDESGAHFLHKDGTPY
jgi:hypothetical protein